MSRANTYEARQRHYRHLTRPNGDLLSEKDCLLLDLCIQWTKNSSIATSTYKYLLDEKFIRQNHPRTVKRTFANISLYIEAEFKNIHVINGVTHKDRIRIERAVDFDLKMEEAKQKNQGKTSQKGGQECPPSLTQMSTMVDKNVHPSTYIYKNTKKNTLNDIIDNQDNQFINFSNFSEKDSDSFYEIYEEFLGKDPVFEPEEVLFQEEPKPGISTKDNSWRIKAKDYHKPIGALVVETDQFIEREMLKLQAAGCDVAEIKDNHKINLDINKGVLESSVCLEIPESLKTKQYVATNVSRLVEKELVQTKPIQANKVIQAQVKPQQQATIHQYNLIKDRVSFVDKDGNTYWGLPLVKFRYTRVMIEQIRLGSTKQHFTHERIVGLLSYLADKHPDKLIIGGKAGFINYMTKVANGEMEYTKEEKLESIEDKRKKAVAELDRILAEGNQIQWA